MKRDTVGKISSDLMDKPYESVTTTDLGREMRTDYIKNIYEAVDKYKKDHDKDFFIVVLQKRERLMENVLRNYFFCRETCPTPDYDQIVYKYHSERDIVEFIWVIPSQDTCHYFINNHLLIPDKEKELLKFVLDFKDGTLFLKCKKLNNEEIETPKLQK